MDLLNGLLKQLRTDPANARDTLRNILSLAKAMPLVVVGMLTHGLKPGPLRDYVTANPDRAVADLTDVITVVLAKPALVDALVAQYAPNAPKPKGSLAPKARR